VTRYSYSSRAVFIVLSIRLDFEENTFKECGVCNINQAFDLINLISSGQFNLISSGQF
jgi:hypothetical protein